MKCLLVFFILCFTGGSLYGEHESIDYHDEYSYDDTDTAVSSEIDDATVYDETDNESYGIEYEDTEDIISDGSDFEGRNVMVTGGLKKEDKKKRRKINKKTMKLFMSEMKAGDKADLIGHNQHIEQSQLYTDLGRRSVQKASANPGKFYSEGNVQDIIPVKASPELVLLVAKASELLGKDTEPKRDFDRNKILRSGDYWNRVWKEQVTPKEVRRAHLQKRPMGPMEKIARDAIAKKEVNPILNFIKF